MKCTTVLYGGVCHRISTPHKTGYKMKEKKTLGYTYLRNIFMWEYFSMSIKFEAGVLFFIFLLLLLFFIIS